MEIRHLEKIPCPLCGFNKTQELLTCPERLFQQEEFKIVSCQRCKFTYVNPRPKKEILWKYYPDFCPSSLPLDQSLIGLIKRIFLAQEKRFWQRRLPSQAKILEIGCGSGQELAFLIKHTQWKGIGTEIKKDQSEPDLGIKIYSSEIFELNFPPEYFDLIRMKHVIEHLYNLKKTLTEVRRILKKNGYLYLALPNFDSWEAKLFEKYWDGLDAPRHLYFFTPLSLEKFLSQSGFKIISLKYDLAPNSWINSFKNLLKLKFSLPSLAKFFTLYNPLLLILFTPLTGLAALKRKTGRIKVIAQRI